MKGQVTVEYLLITLIALTLLSFSLNVLTNANNAQQSGYERAKFLSDANDISHAMKEVCVLGDGNSRKINLKTEIKISGKETVVIEGMYENLTHQEEIPCDVSSSGTFSGTVYVKNDGGSIVVEQ
ncbi:MAG: hypothetical protein QXY61_00975 [Candidatus Anstonellales archaeon]